MWMNVAMSVVCLPRNSFVNTNQISVHLEHFLQFLQLGFLSHMKIYCDDLRYRTTYEMRTKFDAHVLLIHNQQNHPTKKESVTNVYRNLVVYTV